ncbi:MAG: hypothetical protein ACOC06_08150 [Halorubrum sp.]
MSAYCRRCDERIPRTADVCPECGYDPGGTVRDLSGVALAFGVILAVVYPPLGVLGLFVGACLFAFSYLTTPTG